VQWLGAGGGAARVVHPAAVCTRETDLGAGPTATPRRGAGLGDGGTAAALNWSALGRVFDLRSRADRARVYETVLQEGRPADILAYVDGALLVDLWEDLELLALFDRAAARDFADVYVLARLFGKDTLLARPRRSTPASTSGCLPT
jgi:hypothetical protein